MNVCMFFEGTGQGVAGKITNVTRLRDLCVDDARQKLHLEPGLGTHFGSYFAAWLDKLGVAVAYLGLWDTVDATVGLDVSADCPRNVRRARHAVSRDETRKFFQYIPIKGDKKQVVEMLFPGSHSDVGGLYDDNSSASSPLPRSRGMRWLVGSS